MSKLLGVILAATCEFCTFSPFQATANASRVFLLGRNLPDCSNERSKHFRRS